MRRSLFMLAAAALALVGCAKSEVLEIAQNRLISFEPFVENQTKATNDVINSVNFKEFYVYGATGTLNGNVFTADNGQNEDFYFHNQKVTGGVGKWTYDPLKSWIEGKTFRFAAYANGVGDGTAETAKLTNVTFVPDDHIDTDNDGQDDKYVWGLDIDDYAVGDMDLIAAAPVQSTIVNINNTPPSVGMTFKHVLSKVIIQFKNHENPNNYTLEVVPFNFTANKTGDCSIRFTGEESNTIIGASWDDLKNNSAYELFLSSTNTVGGETVTTYPTWTIGNINSEVYVIPQSNESITIPEIVINTKDSNGNIIHKHQFTNVSLKIDNHTFWKPGYVYRYVADINPGQHYIDFTTSVNNWIDEDNRNQNISHTNTTIE